MEQILSVEETQIKDKKCILLRIKGGKQFVLQCEVSVYYFLGAVENNVCPPIYLQKRRRPGNETLSHPCLLPHKRSETRRQVCSK